MLVMNGTADAPIPYERGRGTSRYAVDGFWSAEKRWRTGARSMLARTATPPRAIRVFFKRFPSAATRVTQ
jgi:hypothetical protein